MQYLKKLTGCHLFVHEFSMLERYVNMYMYIIQENEYMHEEYEREGYVRIYRRTYIQIYNIS